MNGRKTSDGLELTGNLLVLWALLLPGLYVANVLPGANTLSLVAVFFVPWFLGLVVLGVLFVVQR